MSQELDERFFIALYARAFLHPRRAFAALVAEPRQVRVGACAVLVTACVYTLVYFFLSRNGGRPTAFQPWLAIPAENYYRYNLYLSAPSILLAWVAAAGFAQLGAAALGGRGSFESSLSVLGLGIGVASWATGLHDLLTTFVAYVGVLNQRAYEDAMSTPGNGPARNHTRRGDRRARLRHLSSGLRDLQSLANEVECVANTLALARERRGETQPATSRGLPCGCSDNPA